MTGIVGFWPLHEWSGRANDLSGNGNHGTVNGATQGVAGKGGLTAYSFDGSSNVSAPLSSQSQFTISCWVKLDDLTEHTIHSKINSNFDSGWVLFYNSSQSDFVFQPIDGGGSTILSGLPPDNTIESGEWYHITAIIDSGTNVELWINGEVQSTAGFGTYAQNTNNVLIGEDNSATYENLTGNVCGMRTYNRVLSESEIQTLYDWGNGDYVTDRTDGVSRYPLDGNANDVWGSNDGTVNGASVTDDAIRGQAYSFDGTDDWIDTGITSLSSTTSFTVSCWVKSDSWSTFNRFVGKDSVGSPGQFMLRFDNQNGNTEFRVRNSANDTWGVATDSPPPTGSWMHYVGVWDRDAQTVNIYRNGVLVDSVSASFTDTNTNSLPISIGADSDGTDNYTNGNIDEVRIYDYALEPHEVADLYRWGTRGRRLARELVNV